MPDLSQFSPYLIIIAFFGLDVLIVGLAFFVRYQRRQATSRAWDDLALRTGLALRKGSWFTMPELSGEFRRRPLRLYAFSRGSGRNRTSYTGIALTVSNSTGSTLGISPSNTFVDFFGKLFHAQDVEIGNLEFDSRFTIKSHPPDFAKVALDDSMVRMEIMEINGYFNITLSGSMLDFSQRGIQRDTSALERLFNTLSDLADRAEGKKGSGF